MAEEMPRSRLGRGLAALIGDAKAVPETTIDRAPRAPRRVPVGFLTPNPRNPRKTFTDDAMADLTTSIRDKGVLQPLIVRPLGGESYEIIAGERRWRAAQKAGLHDVPVIVREASDKESLELAIIENVQRADLNPMEEARGYQQLADDYQYTQEELAAVVGKSRPHVANTLRLLALPEEVQILVGDGSLSAGQARALLTLPDPAAVAQRIVAEGMTVREVEALADAKGKRGRSRRPAAAPYKDADTRALEKTLSDLLGLAVTIDHRHGKGEIRIRYSNLEQLDDVCRRLRD